MADDMDTHSHDSSSQPHPIARSDSSSSSSTSSEHADESVIHQPIPVRPRLPSRKSSGPLAVPRNSSAVGPTDHDYGPDDVRAMSPRRTSEDIDRLGKEAREKMRMWVFSNFLFEYHCR